MKSLGRWLGALLVLLVSRGRRRRRAERPRLLPEQPPSPRAELVVLVLLLLATISAGAFVPIYLIESLRRIETQLLGLSLGCALAFLSAALIVLAKTLVPEEQISEEYPEPDHLREQEEIDQYVEESGGRFTRGRLLKLAGLGAGGALGAALVTPAVSLGPALDIAQLRRTAWRRGVRLVDDAGEPLRAAAVTVGTFVTAYPERARRNAVGSPLVVVRLPPDELALPPDRRDWGPGGIVAYSKICTHAGCAVSLYRSPLYEPTSARPALICPCHYSTFDPARAGKVLFGPAGRNLPQLPLEIDGDGNLRAAGDFSEPVGPSWWGVRRGNQHGR